MSSFRRQVQRQALDRQARQLIAAAGGRRAMREGIAAGAEDLEDGAAAAPPASPAPRPRWITIAESVAIVLLVMALTAGCVALARIRAATLQRQELPAASCALVEHEA